MEQKKAFDTAHWDLEARLHEKRVYFNRPQLLTQYIGAKTTVIVAGRRTGKTDRSHRLSYYEICSGCLAAQGASLCLPSNTD